MMASGAGSPGKTEERSRDYSGAPVRARIHRRIFLLITLCIIVRIADTGFSKTENCIIVRIADTGFSKTVKIRDHSGERIFFESGIFFEGRILF
jgi:hypothetical protein